MGLVKQFAGPKTNYSGWNRYPPRVFQSGIIFQRSPDSRKYEAMHPHISRVSNLWHGCKRHGIDFDERLRHGPNTQDLHKIRVFKSILEMVDQSISCNWVFTPSGVLSAGAFCKSGGSNLCRGIHSRSKRRDDHNQRNIKLPDCNRLDWVETDQQIRCKKPNRV